MKLLHLDSSLLGEASVSRAISAAVVGRMTALHPEVEVITRDLAVSPISHLSGRYLAGQTEDVKHDQAMQEDLALGGAVLEEFLAADIVVLGVPMYNFTVPSQLKAWVDRVLVAGKTFRYTETGAVGLASGKRVILALSSGGFYRPGTPHAGFEHQESYLRAVFGFIGLPDIVVITADGVATGAERRQVAMAEAVAKAEALPAGLSKA